MNNYAEPRCPWCRAHPGEKHFDPLGFPLFDHWHRDGRAVEHLTIDHLTARTTKEDPDDGRSVDLAPGL